MSYESERFENIRDRIGTLLWRGSWLGLELARYNLVYWLTGSGADRIDYPSGAFQNSSVISNELNTAHIRRLKTGIINRLQAGPETMFPSGGNSSSVSFLDGRESIPRRANPLRNNNFEEFYIESSVAYHDFILSGEGDLANAFGGLTVRSRIGIRLLEINLQHPERSRIRFENWFCKVYDEYDWNYGNLTFLTGVSDDEMIWYRDNSERFTENHRQRGRNYKIFSREWEHNTLYRSVIVNDLGSNDYPIPML
ncbi:hypothetical protein [Runella sp.]|uniref:hypothetical protein n=1 Tax=Runella sp. TaxID=1960881 RepID=UPI003D09E5A1